VFGVGDWSFKVEDNLRTTIFGFPTRECSRDGQFSICLENSFS
jgi:hypothetical protein